MIDTNWILTFGKYKNKSVADILNKEPSYIIWLLDNNILNNDFSKEIIERCEEQREILRREDLEFEFSIPSKFL